jgi:predicted acetyltransferase
MSEVRPVAVRLRVHAMSVEIRRPTEDDRDGVAACMAVSLNFGAGWVEGRKGTLPLEQYRCAVDGDRVVSTAAARPLAQWFGGREVASSGIYGVATLPDRRGTGLASRITTELLREARAAGTPISALYPATLRPYRGIGYEIAGSFVQHTIRLDDLPPVRGSLAVEPYAPEDLEPVRACYRRVASTYDGPIEGTDDTWWTDRIVGHWNPADIHTVVVARGEGGDVEGYLSFVHVPAEGTLGGSFDLEAKHFVWATREALDSLLAFARGYRGLGQSLRFTGPPAEPLALAVEEQRVKPTKTLRWMLRLLDVPVALEARGYPDVSGSATFAVEDPMFESNRGPWRIEAERGAVRVTRADGVRAAVLSTGTLSAMYSGFLSPHDAGRLGLLRAEEVAFLAELLPGRSPFMYDFF